MKKRTLIDLTLIVIFCSIGAYFAYNYLGEDTKNSSPIVKLEETRVTIGDKKVAELIENTGASDSEDSWYPEVMSNRWKYIEVYQSGLLSGNSSTLSKRLAKNSQATDCDFHFIITNGYGGEDGKVEVTSRWDTQQDCTPILGSEDPLLAKNTESHYTVSICLIGDFDTQAPTQKQIASLKGLFNYLLTSTTVKSFNIGFHSNQLPKLFPLDLLIKTRTSK